MTANVKVSLLSGALSGLATCLIAGVCAKAEGKTLFSPVNATSHIVWGETAADQDHLSWKYTGTGLVINEVALTFWAGLYEA